MTDAAVQGALFGYRTMADGTLRLTIDLDELQTALFHEARFTTGVAVAVARLNGESESLGEG